jgi:CRP-like cAMP-binding protein
MPSTSSLLETLRAHPFLEDMAPAHIEKLASIAAEVNFHANDLVFRDGDGKDFFYLILSGWLALEIQAPGRTHRIGTVCEGEALGWSTALPKSRKYFQVRALKPVTALAFKGQQLREMWDADCRLGYDMMLRLLAVVAERLRDTQIQVLDLFGDTQPHED